MSAMSYTRLESILRVVSGWLQLEVGNGEHIVGSAAPLTAAVRSFYQRQPLSVLYTITFRGF